MKYHLIYNELEKCYEIYRYIGKDLFKCFSYVNYEDEIVKLDDDNDNYNGGTITHGVRYINDSIEDNMFNILLSSNDLKEIKDLLNTILDAKKYNL